MFCEKSTLSSDLTFSWPCLAMARSLSSRASVNNCALRLQMRFMSGYLTLVLLDGNFRVRVIHSSLVLEVVVPEDWMSRELIANEKLVFMKVNKIPYLEMWPCFNWWFVLSDDTQKLDISSHHTCKLLNNAKLQIPSSADVKHTDIIKRFISQLTVPHVELDITTL